jgi:hypothetical protein
MPFDHPTDGENMAKGMNARSASAGALANPNTVSKPREGLVTCPIAEVSTPLRHEESIRQRIVAQALPLDSVLSDLLGARGMQRNQTRLSEFGLNNLQVRMSATESDLLHL